MKNTLWHVFGVLFALSTIPAIFAFFVGYAYVTPMRTLELDLAQNIVYALLAGIGPGYVVNWIFIFTKFAKGNERLS